MIYSIRIKEEALLDMKEAHNYYEDSRSGLGEELILALEASFNRISRHPQAFRIRYEKLRADKLNRFPYLVIFRIEGYEVVIFKIYHASRNPVLWKRILGK